jgi:hypothetical protein
VRLAADLRRLLQALGHGLAARARFQVRHHGSTLAAGELVVKEPGELFEQFPAPILGAHTH